MASQLQDVRARRNLLARVLAGRRTSHRTQNQRNLPDRLFRAGTFFFALLILLLAGVMVYQMIDGSSLSIREFGWKFVTTSIWDPVHEEYGALPFVYGTIVSSLLALIIAVPLSIGVAVFLSELAPRWLEQVLSFMVELLAAIPSIVYGLWGIFVLVPWIREEVEPVLSEHLGFLPFFAGAPYGFGMLAASLVLSVMIVPIIASISRDALRSVPRSQREAAYALGATKWESTMLVIKYARSGIFGAALLGLGRALGETMAVTMVIGNRPIISASLFDPGYTMASVLANEFTEATTDMYLNALVEIALLLFAITILVNILARLMIWTMTKNTSRTGKI